MRNHGPGEAQPSYEKADADLFAGAGAPEGSREVLAAGFGGGGGCPLAGGASGGAGADMGAAGQDAGTA